MSTAERLGLEDLRAVAIERHEGHERAHRGGVALVGLQEHVERPGRAERCAPRSGINFCPSSTSGLATSAAIFCFTVYSASLAAHALAREDDAADGARATPPRSRFGIVNDDWNVPMRPVASFAREQLDHVLTRAAA